MKERKKASHPQNHRSGNPNPARPIVSFDQKLDKADQRISYDIEENKRWKKEHRHIKH